MAVVVDIALASTTTKSHAFAICDGNPCTRRRRRCTSISSSSSSSAKPRPAVILPGLGNNSNDYKQLASSLESRGISTVIANVSRFDWLRNAAGLLDSNYWRGTLQPRPVLDWYLERTHKAVSEAKCLADGQKISLIGHSAGGWLARIYLEEFEMEQISLLLTLGTPHRPAPKGVAGVIDQTRGLLDYVDRFCKAPSNAENVKFVCIAGRYIKGERLIRNNITGVSTAPVASGNANLTDTAKQQTVDEIQESRNEKTFRSQFVGQGYKQAFPGGEKLFHKRFCFPQLWCITLEINYFSKVCGVADVWGDGVVPEISAHLEGAINISLEGVYHSPVGSDDFSRPWYGSNTILDNWVHHLFD